MTYYDYATAIAFKLDQWGTQTELHGYKLEMIARKQDWKQSESSRPFLQNIVVTRHPGRTSLAAALPRKFGSKNVS